MTRSPRSSDNPQLPHRRFPFFTQWPLAVRADLRALVKSADSSLAGGQRHLGPAENASLQGLGENQQPDERSTLPPPPGTGHRALGIAPRKGSVTLPPGMALCGRGGGTGQGAPRATTRVAEAPTQRVQSRQAWPSAHPAPGAGIPTPPTRAGSHATVGRGGGRAGRKEAAAAARLARLLHRLFKNR